MVAAPVKFIVTNYLIDTVLREHGLRYPSAVIIINVFAVSHATRVAQSVVNSGFFQLTRSIIKTVFATSYYLLKDGEFLYWQIVIE